MEGRFEYVNVCTYFIGGGSFRGGGAGDTSRDNAFPLVVVVLLVGSAGLDGS